MKRFILVGLMLVLALSASLASAQDETIVDIAVGNDDFSTLVAAIQNADPAVLETLSGEGPFTVFAPTNQAFANLLATLDITAEDLLAQTDLLTTVLLYHVANGAVDAEAVIGLDGENVPTLLEGASVGVEVIDGGVVLNGIVNVVQTDIIASNGIIHVIDEVLLPQVVLDALAGEDEMMEESFVNIRVAHFSPDTPAVDVFVNGEAAITELAYPAVTDFLTLPAGSYEIAVAPAGAGIEAAAIGPATFDLPADAFITVAAVGSLEAGTLEPAVFIKDFSPLPEDTARVTVFHAIADAPAVDVLAGSDRLIFGLEFPGSFITAEGTPNDGAFELDVPAGTYDLTVVPSGASEPIVLDLSGTTLEAGSFYLVTAIGTLSDPDVSVVVIDAETAEGLNVALEGDMMDMEAEEEAMGTIVDVAVADGRFTTLVAAVQAADLVEILSSDAQLLTVFAPTDDAFAALPEGTVEALLEDIPALTDILLYHVVSGENLAEDVVAADFVTTWQGADVTITVTDEGVFLNDTAQVIITDIQASNGVIHVINAVLLPPAANE